MKGCALLSIYCAARYPTTIVARTKTAQTPTLVVRVAVGSGETEHVQMQSTTQVQCSAVGKEGFGLSDLAHTVNERRFEWVETCITVLRTAQHGTTPILPLASIGVLATCTHAYTCTRVHVYSVQYL